MDETTEGLVPYFEEIKSEKSYILSFPIFHMWKDSMA